MGNPNVAGPLNAGALAARGSNWQAGCSERADGVNPRCSSHHATNPPSPLLVRIEAVRNRSRDDPYHDTPRLRQYRDRFGAIRVPNRIPMRVPAQHETDPQSRFPRRRTGHPVPAGHQGHAEGDAAGGRPAADPARGRRGARGRHRAFHLRHRPQQGRDRGPFRPPVRARAHAHRAQAQRRSRALVARPARSRARRASRASSCRSASATRSGARAS